MDRRRTIVQEQLEAELRLLRSQRAVAALEENPQKATTATTKIDTEIEGKRREADAALKGITREEQEEQEKLSQQRRQDEIELLELRGQTHEASMRQIQLETEAEEKRLFQQGHSDEEARRIANETLQIKGRALAADEAAAALQAELADLALARAAIEKDIEVGSVSELDGLEAILRLEQERLPILRQMASLSLERAQQSGDPEAIARAQEFTVALQNIGQAASESQLRLVNLRQETGDALEPVLTDFFAKGEEGANSLDDAIANMALNAINALRRLGSELLASRLIELLGLSFAGSGGGDVRQLSGGSTFSEGGPVGGAGTGTSDSNLAWLSRGEFVVREAIARDPAIRSHLESLNQGLVRPGDIPPIYRVRGYAEGGVVDGPGIPAGAAAPAAGRIDGSLTIELGEGLVANDLENSSATARALIRVIGKNRHAIRRLLRSP